MHSKTHRQNHDFQITYFLAGACHTPDGAYALLCDLREDRQAAVDNYKIGLLRSEAKRMKALARLEYASGGDRLEAQADLIELETVNKTGAVLHAAAVAELAHIDDCIEKIHPLRKYAHLPDPEAHEAAQQEEWKLELIYRAENFLLTTHTIPTDHFATMRMHPEFNSAIIPKIEEIKRLMAEGKIEYLLESKTIKALLEPPKETE